MSPGSRPEISTNKLHMHCHWSNGLSLSSPKPHGIQDLFIIPDFSAYMIIHSRSFPPFHEFNPGLTGILVTNTRICFAVHISLKLCKMNLFSLSGQGENVWK